MPKKKVVRNPATTVRVVSPLADTPEDLDRVGSVEVVFGADADLGKQFVCNEKLVIGRDAEATLNDASISREHCAIFREPPLGIYVLEDLNSTNGTTHNGCPVKERTILSPGDKIYLGSSVLRFALSDKVDFEYNSKVEELVQLDALTGLSTKRQYDAVFDIMSRQALDQRSDLTVIVLDMDGLKSINDTYGHEMGSFSIVEVAKILMRILGPLGHVARFGGDEFVGVFPGLSISDAVQLGTDVCKSVEKHSFEKGKISVHPTVSAGIASYPETTSHPRVLFYEADQALYEAKRNGKNQVVTAG